MSARLLLAIAWLRTTVLRRGVTLVFLLATAAAYASPMIQPRSIELLCSTNGAMKLLVQTADGEEASSHSSHCGLCTAMAEPPLAVPFVLPTRNLTHVKSFFTFSAPLALARPPLPARGPPALS